MSTPRAEQATKTRLHILETAATLFAENGYAHTSTNDIVAASGLTKGAVYHHFASKEQLALVTFRHKQEQLAERSLAAAATAPDALSALRSVLAARAELLVTDRSTRAVLTLGAEFRIEAEPGSEFAEHQELAIAALADLVRRGQAEGAIRAELDPRATGELVFAALIGMDDVSRFLSGLEDLGSRNEQLVDLLIHGLAVSPPRERRSR